HEGTSDPLGPSLQLLDGTGAEGVGGGDERNAPLLLEAMRQLSDRGGLSYPVHAGHEDYRGAAIEVEAQGGVGSSSREDGDDLALHGVQEVLMRARFTAGGERLHHLHETQGGGDAEVGGNENLLQPLQRPLIH